MHYLDQEGIRLSREEALYKAIERQKEITKTYLPKNIIYVNKRVKDVFYMNIPLPQKFTVYKIFH